MKSWYIIEFSGWGDSSYKVVQAKSVQQVVDRIIDPQIDDDDPELTREALMENWTILPDYAEWAVSDDAFYNTIILPAPSGAKGQNKYE